MEKLREERAKLTRTTLWTLDDNNGLGNHRSGLLDGAVSGDLGRCTELEECRSLDYDGAMQYDEVHSLQAYCSF